MESVYVYDTNLLLIIFIFVILLLIILIHNMINRYISICKIQKRMKNIINIIQTPDGILHRKFK